MSFDRIHVLSRAVVISQDHILLCQTLDLEKNFHFLPGGHIELGESAEATVLRELQEEAGVVGRVKGFLGCLENHFKPGHNSICHNHEYNMIFEVTSEALQFPNSIPHQEAHIKLEWHPLSSLPSLDLRPEKLKDYLPEWLQTDSSGAFRSMMA